jgi:hypothetical protein
MHAASTSSAGAELLAQQLRCFELSGALAALVGGAETHEGDLLLERLV